MDCRCDQCLANPQRLQVTLHGPGQVAEIRAERLPAHVAHPLVCGSKLALQRGIGASLTGEAVEVGESVPDQPLTYGRRAGQVLDGVVIVEQHRVSQLPHVFEAPFRTRLFAFASASCVLARCACQVVATIPPSRLRKTSIAADAATAFRLTNFAPR